jgi:hypothetical protein
MNRCKMSCHEILVPLVLCAILLTLLPEAKADDLRSLEMEAEKDWHTTIVQNSETGWLRYISKYLSTTRTDAAVAQFRKLEQKKGANKALRIFGVKVDHIAPAIMPVIGRVTTNQNHPVSYSPTAAFNTFDKIKGTIDTQVMSWRTTGEKGLILNTVSRGETNLFMSGVTSVNSSQPRPIVQSVFSGRGTVFVYACDNRNLNCSVTDRISNLVIVDADFDKGVAKVLTGGGESSSEK